jgi:hypothetical protein
MNRLGRARTLDRGAAPDLWRNTLARIPTVFGRLAYLASLRDANTGEYQHFGLAQAFGDDQAAQVLRETHEQVFADWLCFTLEQQKADLDSYLAALGGDRRTIIENWIRLSPFGSMVPASIRTMERELYTADLDTILELLRAGSGAACPDRDA